METRANHLLIGIFTLVGLLGGMLLFLFLAKAEADREVSYYDIRFDSVSGLRTAGAVRYNGLPVGQVTGMFLDDGRPDSVRVRIEVDADTPVVEGTVATLEMQGVTGVSFVALSGGEPGGAPLTPPAGEEAAEIPSQASAISSLLDGAPRVMEEALQLLEELRETVSPENRAAATGILSNLESATGQVDQVVRDFGSLSDDLSSAARDIAAFTGRLDGVVAATEDAMRAAESTLTVAGDALTRAGPAIDGAGRVMDGADALLNDTLPQLAGQVGGAADTVSRVTEELGASTNDAVLQLTSRLDAVGAQAEARMAEAEATLAALNGALAQAGETLRAVEQASDGVTVVGGLAAERLAQAEGAVAALETTLQDASAALASLDAAGQSARRVMDQDVPAVSAELRAALARTEAIPGVLAEAQGAATAVAEAARAATRLADQTALRVGQAETTLREADMALRSISEAANSARDLATGEGAALVADARAAVASAGRAMEAVDQAARTDLPVIVEDVRRATRTASTTIETLGASLGDAAGKLPALTDQALVTLQDASGAFARANVTMTAINGAMETAATTLGTANSAFASADGIMRNDVQGILSDLSDMAATLDAAAQQVQGDLPGITEELERTMTAARQLATNLNVAVAENQPQINAFLTAGMPQFVRFMQEGRSLMENLQRLVEKLERDPARFLLGTQRPEYRR